MQLTAIRQCCSVWLNKNFHSLIASVANGIGVNQTWILTRDGGTFRPFCIKLEPKFSFVSKSKRLIQSMLKTVVSPGSSKMTVSPSYFRIGSKLEIWKIQNSRFALQQRQHQQQLTIPFRRESWPLCWTVVVRRRPKNTFAYPYHRRTSQEFWWFSNLKFRCFHCWRRDSSSRNCFPFVASAVQTLPVCKCRRNYSDYWDRKRRTI